jgi:hypothetical protein
MLDYALIAQRKSIRKACRWCTICCIRSGSLFPCSHLLQPHDKNFSTVGLCINYPGVTHNTMKVGLEYLRL